MQDTSTDRNFSSNLARGLDVLRAFTATDPVLSNREISDRTGLPKPTVSRLTYTLTTLGYLSRVEQFQKFRLAAGVLSLSYPMLAGMRVRQVARPHMERIARETGCTVNLAMRDQLTAVYVDTCRVDGGNIYQPDIGSTRPLLCTAIGRALIFGASPAERTAILNRLKVLAPEQIERDHGFWEAEQKHYPIRGYTYSTGDWRREIHGIAVPIRQPRREEPVALTCTISAYLLGPDTLKTEVAPRLLDAVRQIEMSCGIN